MWNGAPSSITASALRQRLDERLHCQECAVRRRVHVGEVEHGADPIEPRRDLDHVVDRPELAHAAHHLDPERHGAVLALETLAQLTELVDDRVDRLLAGALEQEPRMEDDHLRSGCLRDPGRMVEHADRHVQLLAALGVPHEAGDRRMNGQRDVMLARELTEALGKLVIHPEPALEVDLARREPAREQRFDCCLGRFPRRDARRAEVELTRHRGGNCLRSSERDARVSAPGRPVRSSAERRLLTCRRQAAT